MSFGWCPRAILHCDVASFNIISKFRQNVDLHSCTSVHNSALGNQYSDCALPHIQYVCPSVKLKFDDIWDCSRTLRFLFIHIKSHRLALDLPRTHKLFSSTLMADRLIWFNTSSASCTIWEEVLRALYVRKGRFVLGLIYQWPNGGTTNPFQGVPNCCVRSIIKFSPSLVNKSLMYWGQQSIELAQGWY